MKDKHRKIRSTKIIKTEQGGGKMEPRQGEGIQ
jgi:hypothetical protein